MASETLQKSDSPDDDDELDDDIENIDLQQPKLSLSIIAEDTLEVRTICLVLVDLMLCFGTPYLLLSFQIQSGYYSNILLFSPYLFVSGDGLQRAVTSARHVAR